MQADTGSIVLGKTLSFSWRIYVDNLVSLLVLSVLANAPTLFLQVYFAFHPPRGPGLSVALSMGLVLALTLLATGCLSVICALATAVLVEKSVLDQEISLGDALKTGMARFPTGIATVALGGVIILGWSVLLFIPGIIWGYYYVFMNEAVALRGLGGMEALRYSKRLVTGHWWNVFWIMFACSLLAVLLAVIPGAVAKVFLGKGLLGGAVQFVLLTFGTAFLHVLRVLLFLALECMKGVGIVSPRKA